MQNSVWSPSGQKPADTEEDGRHADGDYTRPAVLSTAGQTH